jgi:hypothetical protein
MELNHSRHSASPDGSPEIDLQAKLIAPATVDIQTACMPPSRAGALDGTAGVSGGGLSEATGGGRALGETVLLLRKRSRSV